MERIFNPIGGIFNTDQMDPEDEYVSTVHALIADAVDYELSDLMPRRETNTEYYYGERPGLDNLDVEDDYLEDDEAPQQSQAVSTDVRDTVMSIMPSLMRIFASTEHTVFFEPNNEQSVDLAKQQTDYIAYKFWEDNPGFMVLHNAIKDCLTVKVGIVTWHTQVSHEVKQIEFRNITREQLAAALSEADLAGAEPEITELTGDANGDVAYVSVKYTKPNPQLGIEACPPDEFRISRRAKSVETADLVGREYDVRASELIKRGFDKDLVMQYVGEGIYFTEERELRNPGYYTNNPLNDLVHYGIWYVRIDADGDGINELHCIETIGNDYVIVDDYIVSHAKFALFQSDPRPHTAIGDCPADLVTDIQDIKSAILRGSLDSLSETLNPRTAVNETLVNMADALNTERGAIVRTKGDPGSAIKTLVTEFVGGAGFQMMDQLERIRQSRTGISEASKGLDPKALQSTNVIGIDAIVTGAQERIELIARIIAETGMKDLFKGLLREVSENFNQMETVQIRGNWTDFNPSVFDPNMKCKANPSLGKGSDVARLQTLATIKSTQEMIIEKFGLSNPMVSVIEYRNTLEDMLAIANFKNASRYFKEISPDVAKQIATTPKEPDAPTLLAQAELSKVKKDTIAETVKADRENRRLEADINRQNADDDFRRDQLNVQSLIQLAGIFKDWQAAMKDEQDVEKLNEPQ